MTNEEKKEIRRVIGKLDQYAEEFLSLTEHINIDEKSHDLEEIEYMLGDIQGHITDYQTEMGYI